MKLYIRLASLAVIFSLLLSGCIRKSGDGEADRTAENTHSVTDSAFSDESVSSDDKATGTESSGTAAQTSDSPVQTQDSTSPDTSAVTEAPTGGVEFIGTKYTKAQLEALDNTKSGYGPGVNVDADNRPSGATVLQDRYGKYDAVFIAPNSDKVYLTFDLGYENGYTGKIIDTLNEKGVKGLFFVTMDYCRSSPDIVKRIIDEGHVLGNHSIHHYSMPTLSVDTMEAEIMDLHNYIRENYGYEMKLFRPPMGEFSERSLAVAQSLGYQSVFWSFAYLDYDVNNQPATDYAFDKITGAAHGGAVYLLHAVSSTNTAVLGDVIDSLRAKGFVIAKYDS